MCCKSLEKRKKHKTLYQMMKLKKICVVINSTCLKRTFLSEAERPAGCEDGAHFALCAGVIL